MESKNKIPVGQIRKAIRKNRELSARFTRREGKNQINKNGLWDIYDSDLESVSQDFFYCLPREYQELNKEFARVEILEKYIMDVLGENNLVAIEFGGSGSRLFASFPENFFQKTIGVCLKDIRTGPEKKEDELQNHEVVCGDILEVVNKNNNLYKEVREKLGGKKVSLIISRICGPLDELDKNPAILDRVIRKWYELLEENGLIFVQIIFSVKIKPFSEEIRKWCKTISEKFPTIEIQEKQGLSNMPEDAVTSEFIGALRIHKKPGSPEKLPPATQLFKKEIGLD